MDLMPAIPARYFPYLAAMNAALTFLAGSSLPAPYGLVVATAAVFVATLIRPTAPPGAKP